MNDCKTCSTPGAVWAPSEGHANWCETCHCCHDPKVGHRNPPPRIGATRIAAAPKAAAPERLWNISVRSSGTDLGNFPGASEAEAVLKMRREAGYKDVVEIAEVLSATIEALDSDLAVTEVVPPSGCESSSALTPEEWPAYRKRGIGTSEVEAVDPRPTPPDPEGCNVLLLVSGSSDSDLSLILIRDICDGCLEPLEDIHERYLGDEERDGKPLTADEIAAHEFLKSWRAGDVSQAGTPLCGCQVPGRLEEFSASEAPEFWASTRIDVVLKTGRF